MNNIPRNLRFSAPFIRAVGDAIAPAGEGQGRLCIVNYHRILQTPDLLLESEPTVETFRWQMDLLAECFNVLPLSDAVMKISNGRMPPRAVAITFDDGYRSLHELALPILRERNLPATVFVTTGHMINESSMWNDVILEAIRCLPNDPIDLRDIGLDVYQLAGPGERKASAALLTERCKYLQPSARRLMLDRLQHLAKCNLQQHLMLTRDMLGDLLEHRVEIGGHTVTHPILTSLDDATAYQEIADNKRDLERVTGRPMRLFAYPNGKPGIDFDQRHVQMVRTAGYDAAFTTEIGAATRHHDTFKLPRSRPWDKQPLMFAGRLLNWLRGRSL